MSVTSDARRSISPLMFIQTSARGFKIPTERASRIDRRGSICSFDCTSYAAKISLRRKIRVCLFGFPRSVFLIVNCSSRKNQVERRESDFVKFSIEPHDFLTTAHDDCSVSRGLNTGLVFVGRSDERHDVTLAAVVALLSKPRQRRRHATYATRQFAPRAAGQLDAPTLANIIATRSVDSQLRRRLKHSISPKSHNCSENSRKTTHRRYIGNYMALSVVSDCTVRCLEVATLLPR